jgi:hypothetical protein
MADARTSGEGAGAGANEDQVLGNFKAALIEPARVAQGNLTRTRDKLMQFGRKESHEQILLHSLLDPAVDSYQLITEALKKYKKDTSGPLHSKARKESIKGVLAALGIDLDKINAHTTADEIQKLLEKKHHVQLQSPLAHPELVGPPAPTPELAEDYLHRLSETLRRFLLSDKIMGDRNREGTAEHPRQNSFYENIFYTPEAHPFYYYYNEIKKYLGRANGNIVNNPEFASRIQYLIVSIEKLFDVYSEEAHPLLKTDPIQYRLNVLKEFIASDSVWAESERVKRVARFDAMRPVLETMYKTVQGSSYTGKLLVYYWVQEAKMILLGDHSLRRDKIDRMPVIGFEREPVLDFVRDLFSATGYHSFEGKLAQLRDDAKLRESFLEKLRGGDGYRLESKDQYGSKQGPVVDFIEGFLNVKSDEELLAKLQEFKDNKDKFYHTDFKELSEFEIKAKDEPNPVIDFMLQQFGAKNVEDFREKYVGKEIDRKEVDDFLREFKQHGEGADHFFQCCRFLKGDGDKLQLEKGVEILKILEVVNSPVVSGQEEVHLDALQRQMQRMDPRLSFGDVAAKAAGSERRQSFGGHKQTKEEEEMGPPSRRSM